MIYSLCAPYRKPLNRSCLRSLWIETDMTSHEVADVWHANARSQEGADTVPSGTRVLINQPRDVSGMRSRIHIPIREADNCLIQLHHLCCIHSGRLHFRGNPHHEYRIRSQGKSRNCTGNTKSVPRSKFPIPDRNKSDQRIVGG